MEATVPNVSAKSYGRDFLLQLRLHPFSLQKPNNLSNHEIVKDKLYLQQINNCSGSQNSNPPNAYSLPDYKAFVKHDAEPMYRYHRALPENLSRSFPFYASGYKNSTGYHSLSSSKARSVFMPDYINPVRKCSFPSPSSYKFDLLNDDVFSSTIPASQAVPWSKQCCSEEVWNCPDISLQRTSSTKVNFDSISKSKKKVLPIIDPKNGKNILDGICKSAPTSQESILLEEKDSDMKSCILSSEDEELARGSTEDRLVNDLQNDEYGVFPQSSVSGEAFSSISQTPEKLDENQDLLIFSDEEVLKGLSPEKVPSKDVDNNILGNGTDISKVQSLEKTTVDSSIIKQEANLVCVKENLEETIEDSFSDKQEVDLISDNDMKFSYTTCEEPAESFIKKTEFYKMGMGRTFNYQLPSSTQNSIPFSITDDPVTFEDQLKENITILKEKIYSMRQEQQKIAIFQSFLRFKKHQLNEIFRNLDDKKIEIANWECNLANKAKRLQEKESWLEARRQNLKNKEEKLDEREKKFSMNQTTSPSEQVETASTPIVKKSDCEKNGGISLDELSDWFRDKEQNKQRVDKVVNLDRKKEIDTNKPEKTESYKCKYQAAKGVPSKHLRDRSSPVEITSSSKKVVSSEALATELVKYQQLKKSFL